MMEELSFQGEMTRSCSLITGSKALSVCALCMFRACECFMADVMRRFLAKEDVLGMLRRGILLRRNEVGGRYVVQMLVTLALDTGIGECIMKIIPNRGREGHGTQMTLDGSHLSASCYISAAKHHQERNTYCKYLDMYGISFRTLPDVRQAFGCWAPRGHLVRGCGRGPLPENFKYLVDILHICVRSRE
jgi:hypothetical protein